MLEVFLKVQVSAMSFPCPASRKLVQMDANLWDSTDLLSWTCILLKRLELLGATTNKRCIEASFFPQIMVSYCGRLQGLRHRTNRAALDMLDISYQLVVGDVMSVLQIVGEAACLSLPLFIYFFMENFSCPRSN